MTHPIDRALALGLPVVAVPTMAELPAIEAGQQRLLVAREGLYVEARSAALHVRWPLAPAAFPTPYGTVSQIVHAIGGAVPAERVREFVGMAMASPLVEVAAVIEHGGVEAEARLKALSSLSSSGGHVTYADAQIDDEALLIDFHSHGQFQARFSARDDESDRSRRGPYVAMVVGRCDTAQPELSARLVVAGMLLPVTQAELVEAGLLHEA